MKAQKLVALVTGGGRGVGRAISVRLAKEQPVVIAGRTLASLVETQQLIAAEGGEALYVVGDITCNETAEKISALLQQQQWSINTLVLNAGVGKSGSSEGFPLETFRQILDVNVVASFRLAQAFLPPMIERRAGTICVISSLGGLKGISHDAAYAASKHALVGMARSLAVEYGKYGISVVPICPGFVESEMTDRSIASCAERHGISLAGARARIEATSPQRRIIPPEEVAEVVAFLSSGKVPSLSGSPLIMAGGGM